MNKCITCPFNEGITEEADQIQNYGCLPTKFDNINCFDRRGYSISCHEHDRAHCRGLVEERPKAVKKPVLAYSRWYQEGYVSP